MKKLITRLLLAIIALAILVLLAAPFFSKLPPVQSYCTWHNFMETRSNIAADSSEEQLERCKEMNAIFRELVPKNVTWVADYTNYWIDGGYRAQYHALVKTQKGYYQQIVYDMDYTLSSNVAAFYHGITGLPFPSEVAFNRYSELVINRNDPLYEEYQRFDTKFVYEYLCDQAFQQVYGGEDNG